MLASTYWPTKGTMPRSFQLELGMMPVHSAPLEPQGTRHYDRHLTGSVIWWNASLTIKHYRRLPV